MSIKGQAMSATTMKKANSMNNRLLCIAGAAAALLLLGSAHAAAPGVKGTAFTLTASPAYISQPDGQTVYSWGYACSGGGSAAPTTITPPATGVCGGVMQIPGPTLIVTEGVAFSVALTNNLPTAAGNTSILFPGLSVSSPPTGGVAGLLTQEAAPGTSVTYHLIANSPGTRAYYSGTQGDLQVEMGLYGAIIVLPSTAPAGCTAVGAVPAHYIAPGNSREADFRLAAAAYDHPRTCYDREYLFQFSEMDLNIHNQALAQVTAKACCAAGTAGCSLVVPTEPYHPAYFTTTTTPGLAFDGIFYWTGKGLNWDAYGHNPASTAASTMPVHAACVPDANGYNTGAPTAINFWEWCQDHNKPMQAHPFGDVASGGPVTLPDPNLFTNGAWYGSSPYLGPDATTRFAGPTGTTPPSGTIANSPTGEAGFAFMWHSHNEREITTNNIFPGGMLMMML